MNSKNIAKSLKNVMNKWVESIEDKELQKAIKKDAIITGGALVSLLNGEKPNDYDVYFKTKETCRAVAQYYAKVWNKNHPESSQVYITDADDRIQCFVRSEGIAAEDESENEEPFSDEEPDVSETEEEQKIEKPKYRPRYFSTNAISLSDKIQIVIRFYGSVEQIHENYDFVHCTCSYDYKKNIVNLPTRALEAIINKELYYTGSKYPLCSIIRTRKFINRGWHINAGQYLKMCLQLNELDLHNFDTFKDQLAGVDSAYFSAAIDAMAKKKDDDPNFEVDDTYLFEVINRIF